MPDPWRLDGRLALVTGGSRGIGAACVAELADRGATVLFCARSDEDVAAASSHHEAAGRRVRGLTADVTTHEGREVLASAVREHGPVLHAVVLNVGSNLRKPTLSWSLADLDDLLRTNTTSAFALLTALHPALAAAGDASVVLVTSVAGHRAVRTSTAGYAATKGALEGLLRFLACEWASEGVRVNAVAPWYVRTPLTEPVLGVAEKREAILERTPLSRVGEPEDVGRAAAFLSLPAAGWITGVTLPVDGGFLALGL